MSGKSQTYQNLERAIRKKEKKRKIIKKDFFRNGHNGWKVRISGEENPQSVTIPYMERSDLYSTP